MNRENNVLVLDEPTNHLDVDAKEELKRALKEYKGNILMVCHEPDFYEGWMDPDLGLPINWHKRVFSVEKSILFYIKEKEAGQILASLFCN